MTHCWKHCWQCNVQRYILTVHTWAMWSTTCCWGDFTVEARKQLLPWVKKQHCGRVTGMDRQAGEAQADSDGWWMLLSLRAHRDWGVFVATNGIVHIFYCNPWLKPRNRGYYVLLDIKVFDAHMVSGVFSTQLKDNKGVKQGEYPSHKLCWIKRHIAVINCVLYIFNSMLGL